MTHARVTVLPYQPHLADLSFLRTPLAVTASVLPEAPQPAQVLLQQAAALPASVLPQQAATVPAATAGPPARPYRPYMPPAHPAAPFEKLQAQVYMPPAQVAAPAEQLHGQPRMKPAQHAAPAHQVSGQPHMAPGQQVPGQPHMVPAHQTAPAEQLHVTPQGSSVMINGLPEYFQSVLQPRQAGLVQTPLHAESFPGFPQLTTSQHTTPPQDPSFQPQGSWANPSLAHRLQNTAAARPASTAAQVWSGRAAVGAVAPHNNAGGSTAAAVAARGQMGRDVVTPRVGKPRRVPKPGSREWAALEDFELAWCNICIARQWPWYCTIKGEFTWLARLYHAVTVCLMACLQSAYMHVWQHLATCKG